MTLPTIGIFLTDSGARNGFSVPVGIRISLLGFASPVAIFETVLLSDKPKRRVGTGPAASGAFSILNCFTCFGKFSILVKAQGNFLKSLGNKNCDTSSGNKLTSKSSKYFFEV